MSFSDPKIWVVLLTLAYAAALLYWARRAALANRGASGFFNGNGQLAPWMTALTMAGASISGWIALGFPETIAVQGFGFVPLALAGIVMPLAGVLFFKRQWIVAKRYGYQSQGALFHAYYGGRSLSVLSAAVALVFAFGFCGMQLRAISLLVTHLFDNNPALPSVVAVLSVLLFAYCVIGGMRAVGTLGSLQTVLLGLGVAGLAAATLTVAGGFAGLNQTLAGLAQSGAEPAQRLFEIAGVIQFTAGLGVEAPVGNPWTAVMVFSTALALMGFQATPMATQLIISTRSPSAIAAGQTWVMAGFAGGLVVFGIVIIGAGALGAVGAGPALLDLLRDLGRTSPWFAAGLVICLAAAAQLLAGLCLVTAANGLIRDVYRPFFHKGLGEREAVLYGRVLIGLILLASALCAVLAPVGLSTIGALALPASFQLWPALLGVCWLRAISPPAAATGAFIGVFAVILTDRLGGDVLGFLGLDLPWGRWPWTIHSAAWGMAFNLAGVILISAATRHRGASREALAIADFLKSHSSRKARSRALLPTAWSAVLAWFFLALGPGVVLGNFAFGAPESGLDGWTVGMPSLWAWTVLFWVLGVFMIWFLAYKLELATGTQEAVEPVQDLARMPVRNRAMQSGEVLRFAWTVAGLAGLVTLTAWVFG